MAKYLTYTNYNATNRRKSAWTAVVIIAALLIGAVSVFLLLAENDYDIGKALGMRENDTSSTDAEVATLPAMAVITAPKDEYNFLLVCGEDGKDLSFMAEICVTLSTAKITVDAVSAQQVLSYNGRMLTVAEIFRDYPYDLINCYRENCDVTFDKYFRLTDSRFKSLMTDLGSITVMIEQDIPYTVDDVTYTFRKGENYLTSDLLLKYMTLSAVGEQLLANQEQALCAVLRTHFTDALVNGGEAYFSSFISYFSTDVSIYDYLSAADVINTLLRSSPTIEAVS